MKTQDQPILVQGTDEWRRHRHGKISASKVGDLISKKPEFTKTALAYLNELEGDRMLAPEILNDPVKYADWLERTKKSSFAMDWGKYFENKARDEFAAMMGWHIEQVGTYTHDEFSYLLASPDGVVTDLNLLIEIKCPQVKNFVDYAKGIRRGLSLKEIETSYYWQVQTQLACTNADGCAFVVYHPDEFPRLYWMMVERNEDDIKLLLERVAAAEALMQADIELLKSDVL